MTDRIFQSDKRAIVEKAGRHGEISEGSRTKFVTISFVASDLFQSEIFILSDSFEDDVALS